MDIELRVPHSATDISTSSYSCISEVENETHGSNTCSYEEAVDLYGTGRYQLFLTIILCIVPWSTACGNFGYIWIGAKMNHTCVTPNSTNGSALIGEVAYFYEPSEDQCSYRTVVMYDNSTSRTINHTPCIRWTYDKTYFESTIVSEWDLNACNGKWKISVATSLYMFGYLAGCFLFGFLSDRFGRRNMLLVSSLGLVVSGLLSSFSVDIIMLAVMKLILGIFVAGCRNSAFVYMAEILAPKWRVWTGTIANLTYMTSAVLLTLTAQLTRDWRKLLLYTSLSYSIFVPYYWLLLESPQWLLTHGRQNEVIAYFKRSALVNNVTMPDNLMVYQHHYRPEKTGFAQLKGFVKTKQIAMITVLLCLAWLIVSCTVFGITYNIGNMAGNIFYNSYIIKSFGLLSVTGLIVIRKGRRFLIMIGFAAVAILLMTVVFLLTIFKDLPGTHEAVPVIAGFGSVFTSYSYAGLYVITSEIYATNMRVTALGLGSAFARAGGALAPYLVLSSDVMEPLPYIICVGLSIIATLISFVLPETEDKPLPETVSEMEQQFKVACPCRC